MSTLCHWLNNNIFLIVLPSLKYTIISFHTFSLIDKSNPSSMWDVCHIFLFFILFLFKQYLFSTFALRADAHLESLRCFTITITHDQIKTNITKEKSLFVTFEPSYNNGSSSHGCSSVVEHLAVFHNQVITKLIFRKLQYLVCSRHVCVLLGDTNMATTKLYKSRFNVIIFHFKFV